jgi:hypothetical protein
MNRKLLAAAAALAITASPATAGSLFYNAGTFVDKCSPTGTDGCLPAHASASFSLSGNKLSVVLTNTTVNPWQEAQNIGPFFSD